MSSGHFISLLADLGDPCRALVKFRSGRHMLNCLDKSAVHRILEQLRVLAILQAWINGPKQ